MTSKNLNINIDELEIFVVFSYLIFYDIYLALFYTLGFVVFFLSYSKIILSINKYIQKKII